MGATAIALQEIKAFGQFVYIFQLSSPAIGAVSCPPPTPLRINVHQHDYITLLGGGNYPENIQNKIAKALESFLTETGLLRTL